MEQVFHRDISSFLFAIFTCKKHNEHHWYGLQGIRGYLCDQRLKYLASAKPASWENISSGCDLWPYQLFEICSLQSPGLLPCSCSFFSSCNFIASLLKQRWKNLYKFMSDCQWQNLQRTTKEEAWIKGRVIPEGATRKELLPASWYASRLCQLLEWKK